MRSQPLFFYLACAEKGKLNRCGCGLVVLTLRAQSVRRMKIIENKPTRKFGGLPEGRIRIYHDTAKILSRLSSFKGGLVGLLSSEFLFFRFSNLLGALGFLSSAHSGRVRWGLGCRLAG